MPLWSVGAYLDRIDCQADFCRVHATSGGYSLQSTSATALGSGLGWRWAVDPAWSVAASVTDLNTRLQVRSVVTDEAGTRTSESTGVLSSPHHRRSGRAQGPLRQARAGPAGAAPGW